MRNLLAFLALAAMLAACAKMTVDSAAKTQEKRDRADEVRCEAQDAGWAQACNRMQALKEARESEYDAPAPTAQVSVPTQSVNTLGGVQ